MLESNRIKIRLPRALVERLRERARAEGTDIDKLIHMAVVADLINADLRRLCARQRRSSRAGGKGGNYDGGRTAGSRAAWQR
jgi:hypothetical protein